MTSIKQQERWSYIDKIIQFLFETKQLEQTSGDKY